MGAVRYWDGTQPMFPFGSFTCRHTVPSASLSSPTICNTVPSIQATNLSDERGVRRRNTPSPPVLAILTKTGGGTGVGEGWGVGVRDVRSIFVDGFGMEAGNSALALMKLNIGLDVTPEMTNLVPKNSARATAKRSRTVVMKIALEPISPASVS